MVSSHWVPLTWDFSITWSVLLGIMKFMWGKISIRGKKANVFKSWKLRLLRTLFLHATQVCLFSVKPNSKHLFLCLRTWLGLCLCFVDTLVAFFCSELVKEEKKSGPSQWAQPLRCLSRSSLSLKSSSDPQASRLRLGSEQDLILPHFKSCAQLLSLSQIMKSHQRIA